MRETTVIKLSNHLQAILDQSTNYNAYAAANNLSASYFSVMKSKVDDDLAAGTISQANYKHLKELYNAIDDKGRTGLAAKLAEITNTANSGRSTVPQTSNATKEITEEYNEDARGSAIYERNQDGKIIAYSFKVCIRDSEPLVGRLTRDELNTICRLYSFYGASITQREVSRYFPEYSLQDFKRILRVFNITKASAPFAPHIIEENTKEELLEMQIREKENDFLRSFEQEEVKSNKRLLKKYAAENQELKEQLENQRGVLEGFEIPEDRWEISRTVQGEHNLMIWLSDMHIGASVKESSIYCNKYDKAEVEARLARILNSVNLLAATYTFKNIIVCNLGDSLDGYNKQTTRGGHALEQNMDNKEQVHAFINLMSRFMRALAENIPAAYIKYYCVGESNHDGDFGYVTNIALASILESQGIQATVFDKFIGEFELCGTTYILCHGKDNKDMFKNLPLTLDVKTENFINEYIDVKGIKGNIVFVKGDLHQSATTYGRRFTYKSVSSLFGSSEWIHKNFGNTPAACDYSVVDNNSNMLDGRIIVQ